MFVFELCFAVTFEIQSDHVFSYFKSFLSGFYNHNYAFCLAKIKKNSNFLEHSFRGAAVVH